MEFCGLFSESIGYGTDRKVPNICYKNENANPVRLIDPGDYKRHDHRGPSNPQGSKE